MCKMSMVGAIAVSALCASSVFHGQSGAPRQFAVASVKPSLVDSDPWRV